MHSSKGMREGRIRAQGDYQLTQKKWHHLSERKMKTVRSWWGKGDEFHFGHSQLELSLGYPSGMLSQQVDIGSGAQEGI